MTLRNGYQIVFKNRSEMIEKVSNNPYTGMIKTDKNEYSTDFILRWLKFGFLIIEKK